MTNLKKPKRKVDQNILDIYRNISCCICAMRPVDPCHIKTRGSGGPDEHWNLVALCRKHHTEQGQLGFLTMFEKYPFFRQVIAAKGWVIDGNKKLRRE